MNSKLTVNCEKSNLKLIREFLTDQLKTFHIKDENFCYLIVTAVDEACTNSFEHAHHFNREHSITLETYKENNEIHIDIFDPAPPFDINNFKCKGLAAKIECCDDGGLGVSMIQKIMDDIKIESIEGASLYKFTKKIPMN